MGHIIYNEKRDLLFLRVIMFFFCWIDKRNINVNPSLDQPVMVSH